MESIPRQSFNEIKANQTTLDLLTLPSSACGSHYMLVFTNMFTVRVTGFVFHKWCLLKQEHFFKFLSKLSIWGKTTFVCLSSKTYPWRWHAGEHASTSQLLFAKVCVSFNYSNNDVGCGEPETILPVNLCIFTSKWAVFVHSIFRSPAEWSSIRVNTRYS